MTFSYNACVGAVVRVARQRLDITQEDLAARAGLVGKSRVSAVELGRYNVTLDTLAGIAEGLQVTPSALLRVADRVVSLAELGGMRYDPTGDGTIDARRLEAVNAWCRQAWGEVMNYTFPNDKGTR